MIPGPLVLLLCAIIIAVALVWDNRHYDLDDDEDV